MARSNTQEGQARLQPVSDPKRRDAIITAISSFDIAESDAWNRLNELSTHTSVDSIEANTEGVFDAGPHKFEATATVYVNLNYGDKRDSFATADAFPAHVKGRIENGNQVVIEDFTVDTSSFFDGDAEMQI